MALSVVTTLRAIQATRPLLVCLIMAPARGRPWEDLGTQTQYSRHKDGKEQNLSQHDKEVTGAQGLKLDHQSKQNSKEKQ
ncbi:hypothetical protein I79_018223 [Cricetulus griseus]|uniref:Uncharacterized protein n=1 Tax=Cricetulus griseus TaxID=10029 RepID=G3I448_CRIGR|nr:hypothetical protein I79_018223 [Cricetulus griseus]